MKSIKGKQINDRGTVMAVARDRDRVRDRTDKDKVRVKIDKVKDKANAKMDRVSDRVDKVNVRMVKGKANVHRVVPMLGVLNPKGRDALAKTKTADRVKVPMHV